MQSQFEALKELLHSYAVPSKKEGMEKYMKNLFSYISVPSPNRKEALAIFNEAWKPNNHQELIEWTTLLWNSNEREFQYVAMEHFFKYRKLWLESDIDFIEWLLATKSWWDTVDALAATIVGEFFKKFPHQFESNMSKWIASDNMWINRTAIICQLKYGKNTQTNWLEKSILPHTKSKEFFHQKAIGWALRQYARTDLDWVVSFVNAHELKPLSRREALKHHKHLL